MHLDGQFTVAADRETAYAFLTDPQRLGRYMPDVKSVDVQDADHFTVKAAVGISHIKGTMTMKLTISDRQPPVSTTVSGKGSGMASAVDMVTSFVLDVAPTGETVVTWQGDVTISGSLASFGPQGLLDRMARANVEKFVDGIKRGIAELTPQT
jgi:carbon monoxide dehydrogenase subunit G